MNAAPAIDETPGLWPIAGAYAVGVCRHAGRIISIETDAAPPTAPAEELPLFLPAPVDLHVHGAGGADAMQGDAALRRMLEVQASLGCGALLATSVCAPFAAIDEFLASVSRVMRSPDPGSAFLLGAHLEGPFVSPDKLGAQPAHAALLDVSVLERWCASGVVRVITYAPECDVDGAVPALCERYGVRAQIGHTLCGWAAAVRALDAGCGVTHLWNAMSGATHRDGGAAIAALARARYAEIIADGIHVDRAAFEAARRAIPALYGVTDGTAAVGMPDGSYRLGSLAVRRAGSRVILADGTLAGSCLDQRRQIEVLRQWGLDWPEIASMTSARPAAWIDADGFGAIRAGARAHWLEVRAGRAVGLWLDGVRQALADESRAGTVPSA